MTAPLTAGQRSALEAQLVLEQARTTARVVALSRDFDEIVASATVANIDDEHDPEGSTIAFERAQVAALLDLAVSDAAALGQAQQRLHDASYGTSAGCGGPIGFERLLALPTTRTCVACAALG